MAITDYASLKQAITDWVNRADLDTFVDSFIQSAEERIYNDVFALNMGNGCAAMENAFAGGSAIGSDGTFALPADFLALKSLLCAIGSGFRKLDRRTLEFIYTQYPNRQASGPPQYVARQGTSLIFGPMPDANYALSGIYWQKDPALSVSNTSTWMTSSIPMTLLAACNSAASSFMKDQNNTQFWEAAYYKQLQSYLTADRLRDQSGSALAMVSA
jgi:hypothetical protein